MAEELSIQVKKIERALVSAEPLETGKFIYCTDTREAFFDEDTKLRIFLGKIKTVDFEEELKAPNVNDMNSFVFIIQDNILKYTGSDLKWININTRDELTNILGSVDRFLPYNLIKNGQLIAPRTISSCVVTNDGSTLEELLNRLSDIINDWKINGIPGELITSGTVSYERIPKEARMDFVVVPNTEYRLNLTIDQVQNGDVVQQDDTGMMYFVVDDTKLGSEGAFKTFTVGSAPWANIVNKPISLTLINGAIGTTSLNTGGTLASQKLKIDVSLNVDHVSAGVLDKKYGGTGNQTNTAAFVEKDTKESEMHIAGFQPNGKMQESSVTIKNGIIKATKIETTDNNISSTITNLDTKRIIIEGEPSDIVGKDTAGEIYNITNFTKTKNIYGDTKNNIGSKLVGYDVEIEATRKIINRVDNKDILTINNDKIISSVPIDCKEKLTIKNNNIIVGEVGEFPVGKSVVYTTGNIDTNGLPSGMTTSIAVSNIKALGINASNHTYVIKKAPGLGANANADNVVEIRSDYVKLNSATFVSGELNVFGTVKVKDKIYGTSSQADNADKLDGLHASDFMRNDGSNNKNPSVMTQSTAPAGRLNCIWINTTTGVVNYWNGSDWTPISNTWKT